MNELTYNKTFNEWQQELDTELVKSAEGFVKIGYLLKVARDTDILKNSGYTGIVEFAKARYGLDKTQVSRFIHINDRFSEGGNSEELKENYKGMGYAKLTIMLQLPDEINEEITPDFSKSEIEEIKKEYEEEKKISDLEVWAEGTAEETKEFNELGQVLYQLLHDNPELFKKIYETSLTEDELTDILAPSGEMIYSVRLQGIGRVMMSIKTELGRITLTNTRSMEKTEWNIVDLAAAAIDVYSRISLDLDNAKAAYEKMFNEQFPEKQEVAPVQQEDKKPVVKKEKKVQKAKVEKPVKEKPKKETEEEQQVPEQDSIENHPEYMPEIVSDKPENTSDEVEDANVAADVKDEPESTSETQTNAINTECEEVSYSNNDEEKIKTQIKESWESISEALLKISNIIEDNKGYIYGIDNHDIDSAYEKAILITTELEKIAKLQSQYFA